MQLVEFSGHMTNLIEAFGKHSFPNIVTERIWKHMKSLPTEEMQRAVLFAVDNLDKAPRVIFFKGFANAYWAQHRDLESRPGVLECFSCDDVGVLQGAYPGGKALLRCSCTYGKSLPWALPINHETLSNSGEVSKLPVEWFKASSETLNQKARIWREKIKASERFWENGGE